MRSKRLISEVLAGVSYIYMYIFNPLVFCNATNVSINMDRLAEGWRDFACNYRQVVQVHMVWIYLLCAISLSGKDAWLSS